MPDDREKGGFGDLPPSAKLVAKVIENEGSMGVAEISESARLPQSTTRYALNKLVERDLVEVSVDSDGGRRLVYTMDG